MNLGKANAVVHTSHPTQTSQDFANKGVADEFLRSNVKGLSTQNKVRMAHLVKFISIATRETYQSCPWITITKDEVKNCLVEYIGFEDGLVAPFIASALIHIAKIEDPLLCQAKEWFLSTYTDEGATCISRHAKNFITDPETDGGLGLDLDTISLKSSQINEALSTGLHNNIQHLIEIWGFFSDIRASGITIITGASLTSKPENVITVCNLFRDGELMIRAICHDELENRLVKGDNPLDDSGKDYKYLSVSLLPAANAQQGMYLFASDPIAILIDHRGAAVDKSGQKKLCPHIVGLYKENRVTKAIPTRSAKINKSETESVKDLAKTISASAKQLGAVLTNSEVLWVGLEPERIKGICIRVQYGTLPNDKTIQKLIDIMKQRDFGKRGAIHENYPVFFYNETSPHKLIQIVIDSKSTVSQIKSQLIVALSPTAVSITKDTSISAQTTSTSKYASVDEAHFKKLTEIMNKLYHPGEQHVNNPLGFSIASLIEKLCHPQIGYIRMGMIRSLLEKVIKKYDVQKYFDITPLITQMHSIIDIDSINYNLASNGCRQLSQKTCESLKSNNCSYIVRRQIIHLTAVETTNIPLTTNDVEKIIEFINDETITVIPKALYRFSCKERWIGGFDELSSALHKRLESIDPSFQFDGDFEPPAPIKISAVNTAVQALLTKEFP